MGPPPIRELGGRPEKKRENGMTLKSRNGRGGKIDRQRRRLVKLMGASGAAAVAPAWLYSAGAAARPIKIGMISPSTGPIAAFGEADQWILSEIKKTLAKGVTVAGETHPVEILYRDSQSN